MPTVATLKNNIHEMVVNTGDIETLQMVEIYFRSLVSDTDWWDEISVKERQLIHQGAKEIEEGKGLPHDEVHQQIDQRLGLK